jgi:hypothetical protein
MKKEDGGQRWIVGQLFHTLTPNCVKKKQKDKEENKGNITNEKEGEKE